MTKIIIIVLIFALISGGVIIGSTKLKTIFSDNSSDTPSNNVLKQGQEKPGSFIDVNDLDELESIATQNKEGPKQENSEITDWLEYKHPLYGYK